jgi:hypothetical protein
MDSIFSTGALIPAWILGAGLVAGVIALVLSPTPNRRP